MTRRASDWRVETTLTNQFALPTVGHSFASVRAFVIQIKKRNEKSLNEYEKVLLKKCVFDNNKRMKKEMISGISEIKLKL